MDRRGLTQAAVPLDEIACGVDEAALANPTPSLFTNHFYSATGTFSESSQIWSLRVVREVGDQCRKVQADIQSVDILWA